MTNRLPTLLRSSHAPLRVRAFAWLLALLLIASLAAACGDGSPTGTDDPPETREVGVVVNSVEVTLTLLDVEDDEASPRTVDLDIPDGTPVGASVRDTLALVPMGIWPAAVVVDLRSASVAGTIPLPEGSGATGSIFLTDSTALVANPGRGTVSPVNVLRGTAGAEIEVGTYPQHLVEAGGRIVVVNSELGPDFQPTGPGSLTVLDPESLEVDATIELSGENPAAAVAGDAERVYVLNAGRAGQGTGSLSVVDLAVESEVAHHEGFGDFPGSIARDGDGRIHVSSWSFGIVSWDPALEAFDRGFDDPVAPGGVESAAGLGVDGEGRLYALFPDCGGPSRVIRFDEDYEEEAEFPVGLCPTGIAFASLADG